MHKKKEELAVNNELGTMFRTYMNVYSQACIQRRMIAHPSDHIGRMIRHPPNSSSIKSKC
uniref:Uncharacterized protein n=1 Tax=Arundo donax TaxID=35708 RepID=A0A0A8YYB1_ARUDO